MNQDKYIGLQPVFDKYNANPDDPTFAPVEKAILDQLKAVQVEIGDIAKQVEQLNKEIKERQDKGSELLQQSIYKQGQNQGLLDTLLALQKG
jgi:hypothetical protein